MADLAETETYEAGIYQLEITDPVIGGPDGIDNLQAKQLANRTNWLKAKIDSILSMSFIHTAVEENPGGTDEFGYWDSFTQTMRRVSLTNFIAVLRTSFDTVYKPIGTLLFSDMPAGSVIQAANYTTGAMATGTALIPWDDTIPQITEGTEFMSLAFTPKKANSLLRVDVTILLASSTTVNGLIAAIFRDSTGGAIGASYSEIYATSMMSQTLTSFIPANATSLTTLRVRAGASTAATVTFNGQASARKFGGVASSSITITEIAQ